MLHLYDITVFTGILVTEFLYVLAALLFYRDIS